MKKILTTILAGTLVAGAAFAADAKITLNFRSRLNTFAMTNYDNGVTEETTRDWMNWDNTHAYNGAGSDTFKFVLNGDRAGATFAVNLATKNDGLFTLNEYSGWMNFPVGPGTLTLRTGNWKDGYADGNYRVKKDVDAQNGEGVDFERFKLGSMFKNGDGRLNFVDNLAEPANNKAIAGFADYGLNVNDNVSLNILVGGVSSGVSTTTTYTMSTDSEVVKADDKKQTQSTTGTTSSSNSDVNFDSYSDTDDDGNTTKVRWNSAFVSRAQVKVKDVLNAELIYKLSHKQNQSLRHTFGLYVMPQVLDALTLNIGGAAEVYGGDHGKEGDAKGDYFDWAVDLRARYQVMDPLSITFFTNVSGTNLDAGRTISGENIGYDGKQGYINQKYIFNNKGKAAGSTFKVAMWNNLSGRYKINDLLTATLNVGLITPLSKVDGDDTSYGPEWRVTPAVQIYAASNASLWAGVAISGSSWTVKGTTDLDRSVLCVDIPVIFRVKM